MRCSPFVLGLAGLAVCLFGCSDGEHASPRATAQTLHAACRAGDRQAVLACFSRESRRKIVELEEILGQVTRLEGFLDTLIRNARDAEAVYGKEHVTDDEAALEYTLDGAEQAMHFVREPAECRHRLFRGSDPQCSPLGHDMRAYPTCQRRQRQTAPRATAPTARRAGAGHSERISPS
jgi:hypothetical protein